MKVGMDCMIPLSESIELASSMYGAWEWNRVYRYNFTPMGSLASGTGNVGSGFTGLFGTGRGRVVVDAVG